MTNAMISITNKKTFFLSLLVLVGILIVTVFVFVFFIRAHHFNERSFQENQPAEENQGIQDFEGSLEQIIAGKNIEDCEKMKDASSKITCRNNIAFNLAIKNLDVSFCQKIDDYLMPIHDCKKAVIAAKKTKEDSPESCNAYPDQSLAARCRTDFHYNKALISGDSSICQNIEDLGIRKSCLDILTIKKETSNPANAANFDCSKLNMPAAQDDCLLYKINMEQKRIVSCFSYGSHEFRMGLCANNKANQ